VDLALTCLVVLVVILVVLGRGLPMTGRTTLIIGGPSMEPTIPLGSAVVVEPVDLSTIRAGDLVSIQAGPETAVFTHRVVRLLALDGVPYIETKGDANPDPDPVTIPLSTIKGRVAVILPSVGYLMAFVATPAGIAFVIGLGMTLVVLAFLLDSFEPRRLVAPTGGQPASHGATTGAGQGASGEPSHPAMAAGSPSPAKAATTPRPSKPAKPARPAKPASAPRPAKSARPRPTSPRAVQPMVEGIVNCVHRESIERRVARHLATRERRLAARPS
jgi:signal peptidase